MIEEKAFSEEPIKLFSVLRAIIICLLSCPFSLYASASAAQQKAPQEQSANQHSEHQHQHPSSMGNREKEETTEKMSIPDIVLLNQDGKRIDFYSDLIKDKAVAINFIFTTCTTICPPLAVTFSKLQDLLSNRLGKDFHLISISVDPATDTPERLKAWGARFGAKSGWTFVTGEKQEVDKLLRALGGYSARKEDHSPTVLIGNDTTGKWTRTYGLAPATKLVNIIEAMINEGHAQQQQNTAAQKYFTDVLLVNQNGDEMRFYSDLLKGKVVVINSFFTSCTSICPPMNRNLEKIQDWLGDRLGKDVYLISLSVDPVTDTPPRLKEYAKGFHAKPGWYFLTGKKENVDWALYKLGQYTEVRDNHTSIVIVGNEPTGLWKKVFGLAKPDEIIKVVESVLNDKADAMR